MSALSPPAAKERRKPAPGGTPAREQSGATNEAERSLSLLSEGVALATPDIDAQAYRTLRANVANLAARLTDPSPEEEKPAALARAVVREFETYRKSAETELGHRANAWRAVTELLLRDLLRSLEIDEGAAGASQLLKRIGSVTTSDEIEKLLAAMDGFLHPGGAGSAPAEVSQFRKADHSTENNNAAGLRGGGSAIAHVKQIMEGGGGGFLVLFRLSCLNMIHQRFGAEAVEDCLMAVSAFLTQNLRSDDATYHWSDSSLLSILQGRVNEQILAAELERIVLKNRETSVNIGGRNTVLRIPITYDITPIAHLELPEDLLKINLLSHSGSKR
jgi:GGDEF domain-containing protein